MKQKNVIVTNCKYKKIFRKKQAKNTGGVLFFISSANVCPLMELRDHRFSANEQGWQHIE